MAVAVAFVELEEEAETFQWAVILHIVVALAVVGHDVRNRVRSVAIPLAALLPKFLLNIDLLYEYLPGFGQAMDCAVLVGRVDHAEA